VLPVSFGVYPAFAAVLTRMRTMQATLDVLGELDRAGAILLDQHFVYTSGKHGPGYYNMDLLYPDTALTSRIGALLVDPFRGRFDTIAGPAVGGIALAVLAGAAAATTHPAVRAVWADKTGSGFIFERAGFVDHLAHRRVLVVEDLLTTGGSVAKVCRLIEGHGGRVIGVSVICNLGGIAPEAIGVPRLSALSSARFTAVDPAECALCAAHRPIVEDIGHGAEYKLQNPGYAGGYVRSNGGPPPSAR
jgi:orotate phosphoribosyltransferase